MNNTGIAAAMLALAAGLGAGALLGALFIASDDNNSPPPAVESSATATRTPGDTPTPLPSPLPSETATWDPCTRPGLCDFLETLDGRLVARNVDGLMDMIHFESTQCGTPETELFEGVFPVECRDWPFSQPIPTAGYSEREESGYPVSRWAIRRNLEVFLEGSESDCSGSSAEEIERRITLVVLPPDPDLYWTGEIALLIGPPLDCFPTFDPDSGERIVFNLREIGGEWRIQAIVEIAFNDCEESFYRYVGEIRYYPFGDGRPLIQGSPTCPEGSTG